MPSENIYKLIGVGAYLMILVGIGIVAARRMRDLRDYYAGGKKLGFLSVAFSARATGESAWLLLGLTGMGATVGLKAFWVVLGEVLGVGAAWILLSRRFKRLTDRYDSLTVPDYLESRFRDTSHLIRIVAAVSLVVFVTVYVSAQIDASGSAFESFLGWNYYAGALLGFGIVMIYIVSGGFVAVVWSDVFQGLMMVLGLVVLPIVGLYAAGNWVSVTDGLRAIDPHLLSWSGGDGWGLINVAGIVSLALIGLGFLGSPQIFVRFIALKSDREIRNGTVVALVWTLLADCGAVFIGMIGRHLLVDADLGSGSEAVLPLLTEELLPPLLVGLYIAIVLSAVMSTVDSLLVVASSAAVRDFYQRVLHPELSDQALLRASRLATLAIALFALAVAFTVAATTESRTVFWFVIFGWSGIAATFCPTVILSLFWSGFTGRGALVAMIAGFLCVPLFKFAAPQLPGQLGEFFGALGELPPAFLVSFVLGIAVSALDPAGRERLGDVSRELEGD